MRKAISLITAAAGVVVLVAGAQLAVASSGHQKETAHYQASPAVRSMSRPVNSGTLRAPPDLIAVALTSAQCEGFGGEIKNNSNCAGTGKTCITAGQDGVIHSTCINKMSPPE